MKKAHFVGICGKGMSAVALLLKQSGWDISGSDEGFYPPVSDYLRESSIPFTEGYAKENIPPDADLIVIGKNAKLVPETNEEVKAALESGIDVKSFPEVLEELTRGKETIVVAGSYGKSTSTALLAWVLKEAGQDLSYFIGEVAKGLAAHAHLGESGLFILEGDEYPSSNWDESSKFLHYNAQNLLLTSAVHDHVNVFPTHEDFLAPFEALTRSLPDNGLLVACADEPFAEKLSKSHELRVLYGLDSKDAAWSAENISYGETTSFDLVKNGEKITALTTTLLGKHNIQNIVGVSAMLLEKELVTVGELQKGVASFEGVKRRLELLTTDSSVPVYEGFGSSYEKARSAFDAIALHFPNRRLITIFEPHTFSWRNRAYVHHYDDIFNTSGKVYVFHPASQGAGTHEQLSQEEIVERVQKASVDAEAIRDKEDALEKLSNEVREGDVIMLVTSGELGGLIEAVPEFAEKKFTPK